MLGAPPETMWTISSLSPSWRVMPSHRSRFTISPLYSMAMRRGSILWDCEIAEEGDWGLDFSSLAVY